MSPPPTSAAIALGSVAAPPSVTPPGGAAPAPIAVDPPFDRLLPRGGLGRGEVVAVTGSTSLGIALLTRASRERSWCAVVGLPALGLAAVAEADADLSHLLLIPRPGHRWAEVVAALVDALDVVAVRLPSRLPAAVQRRLVARSRANGTALMVLHGPGDAPVEGAATRLTVVRQRWEGLGDGDGHLRHRRLEVGVAGRGVAARPRTIEIDLPRPSTAVGDLPGRCPVEVDLPGAGATPLLVPVADGEAI